MRKQKGIIQRDEQAYKCGVLFNSILLLSGIYAFSKQQNSFSNIEIKNHNNGINKLLTMQEIEFMLEQLYISCGVLMQQTNNENGKIMYAITNTNPNDSTRQTLWLPLSE